mgnify:CR=1 FL=1
MGNIVIVSEVQSYLIMSLKSWFEQAEYDVTMVKADINAINKIEETPSGRGNASFTQLSIANFPCDSKSNSAS